MALVKTNWINASDSFDPTEPEEVTGTTAYALQAAATGGPGNATVVLQGSLDGADWFSLVTSNPASAPTLAWAVDKPVKYVRLQITILSGGTNPLVTASVVAV